MEDNKHQTCNMISKKVNSSLKSSSQAYHSGYNTICERGEGVYLSYISVDKEHELSVHW